MSELKILREYVRELLKESGGNMESVMGIAMWGSPADMYNIFIKPFTDVVDTAKAEGKKQLIQVRTAVKTGWNVVKTSFIPFTKGHYKEIFAKRDTDLQKINEEYKDIYSANYNAIFKNKDVNACLWMWNPGVMIAKYIIEKSPKEAVKIADHIFGGNIVNIYNGSSAGNLSRNLQSKLGTFGHSIGAERAREGQLGAINQSLGIESRLRLSFGEELITEADEATAQKGKKETLLDFIASDTFVKLVGTHPRVKAAQQKILEVERNNVKTLLASIQGVSAAQTSDDLKKIIKAGGGSVHEAIEPTQQKLGEKTPATQAQQKQATPQPPATPESISPEMQKELAKHEIEGAKAVVKETLLAPIKQSISLANQYGVSGTIVKLWEQVVAAAQNL